MLKKSLMCLMVILLVAGVTEATSFTWTGATTNLWNNAANWTPVGGPPNSIYGGGATNDNAFINNIADPNKYPRIDSTMPLQNVYSIYLGYLAGTVSVPAVMQLNIVDGQFYNSYKSFLSAKAYTNGTLNVSGSNSLVTFVGEMDLATIATSVGTLNVYDGQVKTGQLVIARGAGTVNVYGGSLLGNLATTAIVFPGTATPSEILPKAEINLDGGLMDYYRLNFQTTVPVLDVNDGTFKATCFGAGTDERVFDQYVARGQITAFNDDPRAALNVSLEGAVTVVKASLSAPEQAWNPAPVGRAVPLTSNTLTWSVGAGGVTSHDVYVGSTYAEVDAADTSTAGIFKANRTVANYSFSGGTLGHTVYWRVDERIGAGAPTKGDVWSFVIQAAPVIEDFETYADTAGLTAKWLASGDATVTLSETPNPIRDAKAMKLAYANATTGYSQAAKTFAGGQDWTVSQLNAIDVWYYGDPTNTADTIYMVLSDGTNTAVQYLLDTAIQTAAWNVWHVAMADFTGVNLMAVTSVKVGVGNPITPTPGDKNGTVYFDDLVLYGTRCLTPVARQDGDLNQDCIIDITDFAEMASNWLLDGFFP